MGREGPPTPEQTRQDLTDAQERLRDATAALERQQSLHTRQADEIARRAHLDAESVAARLQQAEADVKQANVFTRGRAREALDQARTAAEQQLGVPLPENPTQLRWPRGESWVDQVAQRRRDEFDAQPDPALDQARTAHAHTAAHHDLATVHHQRTSSRYEADVIRPDDRLTQHARAAARKLDYDDLRKPTSQLRDAADRAEAAIESFDNAPVDEQAKIARRNNTNRLHDAERHYQRDHGHRYDPPTQQHRGPSLGR